MDSSEDTLALADEYEQRAIGELGPHSAHVSPWGPRPGLSPSPVQAVSSGGAAL